MDGGRTVFQQRHLTPRQVVLPVRGIVKGEPSKTLAHELEVHSSTVLKLRPDLQANDRPPIVGTVGRESGQVRLRVVFVLL